MKCITLLDDKDANFHLDRKKVIFSHAYRGSSRSLPGVTTHVKPPGFKQLNWRIRENLSQAINNGSWYKLSLLVSEDAMIVPAKCMFQLNHYFRFCKLGVCKVINRLILSWTPITTVPYQIIYLFCFNHESRFKEILGLSIKCVVMNRKIGLEEVEKNEVWAQEIRKLQSPHQGAIKLRKCLSRGTIPDFSFLEKA